MASIASPGDASTVYAYERCAQEQISQSTWCAVRSLGQLLTMKRPGWITIHGLPLSHMPAHPPIPYNLAGEYGFLNRPGTNHTSTDCSTMTRQQHTQPG